MSGLSELRKQMEIDFLKSKSYEEINEMFNELNDKLNAANSKVDELNLACVSGLLPLTKEYIDSNNSSKTGLIKCRKCNDFALYYKDNYCSNCGEKLLWQ